MDNPTAPTSADPSTGKTSAPPAQAASKASAADPPVQLAIKVLSVTRIGKLLCGPGHKTSLPEPTAVALANQNLVRIAGAL